MTTGEPISCQERLASRHCDESPLNLGRAAADTIPCRKSDFAAVHGCHCNGSANRGDGRLPETKFSSVAAKLANNIVCHDGLCGTVGFPSLRYGIGGSDALSRIAERAYGHLAEGLPREDTLVKLSDSDSRFVVQMLELRRAAILDIIRRLPEQSSKSQAVELKRLDAVLTQITDPEILRPSSSCAAL